MRVDRRAMRPGATLAVTLAMLVGMASASYGHSTRSVSMKEARSAMRTVGDRLSVEFEASDYSYRCYRRSSRRVRCSIYFYSTTVGDCSVKFNVTGHRGKTHVREVGGEGNDDCPA
jgi:hypothetical protein